MTEQPSESAGSGSGPRQPDVLAMAAAERADLADFLDTLTPQQWDEPSLCAGWSVRDVVTHLISFEEHDAREVFRRLRRAGFRFGRLNEVGIADYRHLEPPDLIAFLRTHLTPIGSTARFGGRVGLVDALVHHQDIRRPLGMPRTIPAERLACALPFAVTAPPLRGFWHARGTRLVADDVDWSRGRGPEASGPAEAVLMTLAGRRGAARDLSGPGAAILQRRLG